MKRFGGSRINVHVVGSKSRLLGMKHIAIMIAGLDRGNFHAPLWVTGTSIVVQCNS
jgi:hypothetical protein